MRGRIVSLAGVPADRAKASEDVAWVLEGDRGITFSATLPEGAKLAVGEWWPADYSGPPLVSMERDIAKGLGLKVGDSIVVNVLGRDIEARIANHAPSNGRRSPSISSWCSFAERLHRCPFQ